MTREETTVATALWRLSNCSRSPDRDADVVIKATPFRVGRRPSSDLVLRHADASNSHAEFVVGDDTVTVFDLDSTNGTFINGVRVTETSEAHDGDLLQFATSIFRLRRDHSFTTPTENRLPLGGVRAMLQLDRLMSERCVVPHYQPIVSLASSAVVGHELLARTELDRIRMPAEMFDAAVQSDVAAQLSAMLRIEGVRAIKESGRTGELFVNTWPGEIVTSEAIASLQRLRAYAGDLPITVEVHERAVTSSGEMQRLRDVLYELDMKMAYDDFGTGEDRLTELTVVQPDYVKFDITLVRGLHEASSRRQIRVATLVEMVGDLGIDCIAEGVECEGEAEYCRQIGFDLAQGFHFGRPVPVDELG
jgi:EAL domain-containing protein (putative c-di-GMP-specific phosphodiesterase class I)